MASSGDPARVPAFDPYQLERPDKSLLKYYLIVSLLTGPFFPFVFIPLLFKFETLKYRLDDSGVSMSWGILFRRETYLTYRRIQDIHLTRNIIQRWMGLATLSVQTASGSATPEMSIEGVLFADALRDFLYTQMRGAKGGVESPAHSAEKTTAGSDEVAVLLREIRDHLQRLAVTGGGP